MIGITKISNTCYMETLQSTYAKLALNSRRMCKEMGRVLYYEIPLSDEC